MKQLILVFGVLLALAGCKPDAEVKNYSVLPDELKGCKFFRLTDENGSSITVARCPNSTTTVVQSDKAHTTTVIIDGKEFVEK
jgi:hypothetical protein